MVAPLLDVPSQDTMLVSLVRRPSEQVWSYYQWIKSRSDHPLNSHCSSQSLPEALQNTTISKELSNIQTRYLLGSATSVWEVQTKTRALLRRDNVPISPITQADDLPRKIAGYMPELSTARLPRELPRQNQAKTPYEPTVTDLEAISKITTLDAALYQCVLDVCSGRASPESR